MKIGDEVHVDAAANQWPHERICDEGVIIDLTKRRALVKLKTNRETLWFPRKYCVGDYTPKTLD